MEWVGTILAYAIVGGGALLAVFILVKWMSAAKERTHPRVR